MSFVKLTIWWYTCNAKFFSQTSKPFFLSMIFHEFHNYFVRLESCERIYEKNESASSANSSDLTNIPDLCASIYLGLLWVYKSYRSVVLLSSWYMCTMHILHCTVNFTLPYLYPTLIYGNGTHLSLGCENTQPDRHRDHLLFCHF